MEAKNTAIFAEILETRSLTVIHFIIEDALPNAGDSEDRHWMEGILGLNSLDDIYILCHNRIATWHMKCANEIRQFLEIKRGKR